MKTFLKKIRKQISVSLEEFTSDDLKIYSKIINQIQTKSFLNSKINL
jgi:hypothetical protein